MTTEIIDAATGQSTGLVVSAGRDLRSQMMSLPIEEQNRMFDDGIAKRDNWRSRVLGKMEPGVHFGFPPGCVPVLTERGDAIVKTKKGELVVPKEQWKYKPVLYAAGADFIVEICGLRDEYDNDMLAWEQLGKPEMTYVRKCKLWTRTKNEKGEFDLLGEGTGARKVSENDGSVNDAIKMADKSAKIAAVLNAYALRDLFTQEMERALPERHDNPELDGGQPQVGTREERKKSLTAKEAYEYVTALMKRWNALAKEPSKPNWEAFCHKATGENFAYMKPEQWVIGDRLKSLRNEIVKLEGGEPPPSEPPKDIPF